MRSKNAAANTADKKMAERGPGLNGTAQRLGGRDDTPRSESAAADTADEVMAERVPPERP